MFPVDKPRWKKPPMYVVISSRSVAVLEVPTVCRAQNKNHGAVRRGRLYFRQSSRLDASR